MYGDGGGEFTITAAGPSVGLFDPFETFCMERPADQQPAPQTYVLALETGPSEPDSRPLTVGAAFLYHELHWWRNAWLQLHACRRGPHWRNSW